jgi:glycine cleavage system H lipoate-binding protein
METKTMTVILVLSTFVLFLLIDHFFSKQPAVVMATKPARAANQTVPEARLQPQLVNGFRVPENLRYHPGHTWALNESPSLVRIGIDDFASKMMGKIEQIALPQRGQWVRQGQKIWSVMRNGKKVDMVSPIEGSVADINEEAIRNPELACNDPYGEGWLVTVQSPDAKTNFRNLLGGALARWWTEEAAGRLQRRFPMALGALAQDGGAATHDLTQHIEGAEWSDVVREFFLT